MARSSRFPGGDEDFLDDGVVRLLHAVRSDGWRCCRHAGQSRGCNRDGRNAA